MGIIRLSEGDICLLHDLAPELSYNSKRNMIQGFLSFDLQYEDDEGQLLEPLKDRYKIEIDLNNVTQGLPVVRETEKRIRSLARQRNLHPIELHIFSNDEMCIIIPPKIKERYPNGFDLKTLINHIQEHLYYISFVEKNNKEPWKAYGHGEEGYYELYLENKEKYSEDFRKHFNCSSRPDFRRKLKELRRVYKK